MGDRRVARRRKEENEEVLVDRIERHLPLAHRPVNERPHMVLGVVEHELVARARGDCRKRDERVRGDTPVVRRESRRWIGPCYVGKVEAPQARELRVVEDAWHVRLLDDGLGDASQPVVHLPRTRVVVRPHRRDLGDVSGRRGARPHEPEPFVRSLRQREVGQKQVLLDVPRHEPRSRFRRVEKSFPALDPGPFRFAFLRFRARHIHAATLHTAAGTLELVCASGASLGHPSDAIRAGYNVYDVDEDGRIVSIAARVLKRDGLAMRDVEIPYQCQAARRPRPALV